MQNDSAENNQNLTMNKTTVGENVYNIKSVADHEFLNNSLEESSSKEMINSQI